MPIGFKIHPRLRTVAPATVEKFKSIAVANISDSMNRMSHGGPRLDFAAPRGLNPTARKARPSVAAE